MTTSFASNDAVRDGSGDWQSDQARALLEFSKANDVPLVVAELLDEPGLPLGADDLDGSSIQLNGTQLATHDDGTPPELNPNRVEVPPASVAFIVDRDATGCR